MFALFLAMLAMPSVNTWTVDDDGPADFTQITDAIAQVPAGDVLLVEPGIYGPFELTTRMSILGRPGVPRPHVSGQSLVSASTFTLAGLDFDALSVSGVSGRGRIDDCGVGQAGDAAKPYALDVDGCAQLVISRATVDGSQVYSDAANQPGGSAVSIRTSRVTLVDCDLTGAKGFTIILVNPGGQGGIGLRITDASEVVIAGCSVKGGDEGYAGCLFCSCHDGPGGPGVSIANSSLVVRGSPGDIISGGDADTLCPPVVPGLDIVGTSSTVVASGAFYGSDFSWVSSQLIEPAPPEPYVEIDGPDVPGAHKQIRIRGPAGASCVLAASLLPAYVPLGQFDDKLWVGLSGPYFLVPLVTAGQAQPVVLGFHVPASIAGLEGLSIELQPFFPGLASAVAPGKSIAANVAEIILRF